MNYQMVRGPDGIVWVTLQPLMAEVKAILENSKLIDVTLMDRDERRGIDFTILSLESVYNFLKSLEAEQQVKEMIDKETNK
jgi:hypothetical protein